PDPHPFSTSNPEAASAWGRGEYERAISLDPDFGTAWIARVREFASHGDIKGAEQASTIALERKSLKSEMQRLQVEVLSAEIRKDYRSRAATLKKIAELAQNNVQALRAAADAQNLARDFAEAAKLYRKINMIDPSDAAAMNATG